MIEQYTKYNVKNGDQILVDDPMNKNKKISLNMLYQRLSRYAKNYYPAPFQEVDDIDEYVKIAFELYMSPDEHQNMAELQQNFLAQSQKLVKLGDPS